MEKKKQSTSSCETCIHHAYDETYLAYYCDLLLDEDELERYSYTERSCPFYQFHDEYINVRKQI